jgi:hypothetical protein
LAEIFAGHTHGVLYRLAVVLALTFTCATAFAATQGGAMPVPLPLPLFPSNNWWNTDVSAAPLDTNSASFITFIGGANRGLHPDFGGDAGGGDVYGFPFIVVDGTQPKKTVEFVDYGDQSDGVDHTTETSFPFYPVPDEAITQNGWVEGGQPGNVDQRADGDRHILIVDSSNNTLYELYNVWFNGTNWEAGSGAFFDMSANHRRPAGWTSADAAGLAILPGLVRYDEVFGTDEIRHAFRVTVQSTNGSVYPASHVAGSTAGALPMGARLRLKASKNIASYTPEMQRIFRAMKKYGLIVADNGTNMYVSGTYDTRWNNDVLNPAFDALKASDFEVVQRGWAPSVSLVINIASPAASGAATNATVTAYDVNGNVVTGYRGTIHFTSTDGAATLPMNYTFTAGDSGVHTFTGGFTFRTAGSQVVTATDVATATITGSRGVTVSVAPPTPTGLVATAASSALVQVSWTASPGATQYELLRAAAPGGYGAPIVTTSPSYADSSVTAGAAYVYRVRALDSMAHASALSAPDAATTVVFTDDPLVRAAHLTQLRQAVNALRATAGLAAATFTDTMSVGLSIKAVHLTELRTALAQARSALGLSPITTTDAPPTVIKAVHVQELRNGVR